MPTAADPTTKNEARAYVLGGNANTLAFTSSLVPENRQIDGVARAARVDADRRRARRELAARRRRRRQPRRLDRSDLRSRPTSARSFRRCASSSCSRASAGRPRSPSVSTEDVARQPRRLARRHARRASRTRPSRSCSARSAAAPACATTSCGTSAACARGTTMRPCSASAGRGAPDRTKSGFWDTMPARGVRRRPAARRHRGRRRARDRRPRRRARAPHHQRGDRGRSRARAPRRQHRRRLHPAARARPRRTDQAPATAEHGDAPLTDSAIARLGALFIAAVRAARACGSCWLQVVRRTAARGDQYNPRHAADRGRARLDPRLATARRSRSRAAAEARLPAGRAGRAGGRLRVARATARRASRTPSTACSPRTPTPSTRSPQLREIVAGAHGAPRGADVVTTLDLTVQRALVAGARAHARAAGVVLDPRTGAVLALASVPGYDPNALDALWPSLIHDPPRRCSTARLAGLYPPGSTFKIFTAADALDAGAVTPQSTFSDYRRFDRRQLHRSQRRGAKRPARRTSPARSRSSRTSTSRRSRSRSASTPGSSTPRSGGSARRSTSICRSRATACRRKKDVYAGDPRAARIRPGLAAGHADANGADRRDDRRRRRRAAAVPRAPHRRQRYGVATRPETLAQPISRRHGARGARPDGRGRQARHRDGGRSCPA